MWAKKALLLTGAALFCAGCVFEAPLTDEHAIAIDPAVRGLWEYVPADGEQAGPVEQMLILAYSGTEYLVHYPTGEGGMYFRGYPVRIGDVSCVQLRLIGGDQGPPAADEKDLFHVAAYRLSGDDLEVRTLNTDLVDPDLPDPAALRAAFRKHAGNPELFTDPGRFRRIVPPK